MTFASTQSNASALQGVLLGTAVGDALGLPFEGMNRARIQRLCPGSLKHRFLVGQGMISDDTEHTIFVAQALLQHRDDPHRFQNALARMLRWWLVGVPAGIGLATLRATLRLWLGFGPSRSGVMSAGNGPAMRSAVIGVVFADDAERRREFVSASTRITHIDPRAEVGALAVAECAARCVAQRDDSHEIIGTLALLSDNTEWQKIVAQMASSLDNGHTVQLFADALGLGRGVTGYVFHTVPVALFATLRHPSDFTQALESVIRCGGDTDTAGAITGALMGAKLGTAAIPAPWLEGIADWPRSRQMLFVLADRLTAVTDSGTSTDPVPYFWPAVPFRNIIFLLAVLAHGLRRLFPPY